MLQGKAFAKGVLRRSKSLFLLVIGGLIYNNFHYQAVLSLMTAGDEEETFLPPSVSLSQTYRGIASKALLIENWPDSSKTNQLLKKNRNGVYLVPTFPEDEAPLAVVAIVDRNHAARRITRECDKVFSSFVTELKRILTASHEELGEELDKKIWSTPEGTHHITVAVFQEHPSLLLEEADLRKWRKVPEDVAMQVYNQISNHQTNNGNLLAPLLQLNAIVLTGDGTMIVGFVDRRGDSFQRVRVSCSEIAQKIMGDLTSRPKGLIHVTVGRVLALPDGTSKAQQQAVNDLVRRYNTQILPEKVKAMQQALPDKASFELSEVTMIRDVVWTLRKIKEYGTWRFKL